MIAHGLRRQNVFQVRAAYLHALAGKESKANAAIRNNCDNCKAGIFKRQFAWGIVVDLRHVTFSLVRSYITEDVEPSSYSNTGRIIPQFQRLDGVCAGMACSEHYAFPSGFD